MNPYTLLPPPHLLHPPAAQVIFNAATSKYVLVFHCEDGPYKAGLRGVASSASAAGPFAWEGAARANGLYSMDMTEYVDPNDPARTAYHVRTARVAPLPNVQWTVGSQLSADYLSVAPGPVCFNTSTHTEGPALLFRDGAYYLFGSHLTGLGANPARVLRCEAKMLSECCTPLGAPTKWTGASCGAGGLVLPCSASDQRLVHPSLHLRPPMSFPPYPLAHLLTRSLARSPTHPPTRSGQPGRRARHQPRGPRPGSHLQQPVDRRSAVGRGTARGRRPVDGRRVGP